MLVHVDDKGRVLARGQVMVWKDRHFRSLNVPEHVCGHEVDGKVVPLPDDEKTYTQDGSPVYTSDGEYAKTVDGICLEW